MPAQFNLFGLCEQAKKFCLVALKERWSLRGNFFGGIGCTHSQNWIFVPEASDELAKTARLSQNELNHFIRSPDGPPVGAVQHGCDILHGHASKDGVGKI